MPEYVYHYFRDGVEMPYAQFHKHFNDDLNAEDKWFKAHCGYSIKPTVLTDYGEGHDCELNGHTYSTRCDYHYSSACHLLKDMIGEGRGSELLDAIASLSEDDAKRLVQKLECVTVDGQTYILHEDK